MHLVKTKSRAWNVGLPIRIFEYLRGSHQTYALVEDGPDWKLQCTGNFLIDDNIFSLLNYICDGEVPCFIEGVVVDYGVQDLTLFVTTIYRDQVIVPYDEMLTLSQMFDFRMPPMLYEGTFNWCAVDQFSVGNSLLSPGAGPRAGCIIVSQQEQFSEILEGRLIGMVPNPEVQ